MLIILYMKLVLQTTILLKLQGKITGAKPIVTPGSSLGTSAAGLAADKLLGKTRLPARLPAVVGGLELRCQFTRV